MKYAKLIDNTVVFAPNPILRDGFFIGNPTSAIYLSEGFKPVVYSDPPGDAPSGYQWNEAWGETDTEIVQDWVLVEVPITDEEALVRYANELTGAKDETLTEATETLIKHFKEEE